ncbi:MAG: hypothetical protein HQ553_10515 [Chloroflexi bacterium]|nr:hypothetical protein [Chloroflexota bacterium]
MFLTIVISVVLSISCDGSDSDAGANTLPSPVDSNNQLPDSYILPSSDGEWVPQQTHKARQPVGMGTVDIKGIDKFSFNDLDVETLRPDIFQPGHFSVFDVLVQLDKQGDIDLEYHFDGAMDTHIIDAIDGQPHWWYEVRYSDGWYETNVFRMDMYPYKDDTDIRLFRQSDDRLAQICRTFGDEVRRLTGNNGQVIIPEVVIDGPKTNFRFTDVVVTSHDVRRDVLQPGVITALDILLSLGEQAELSDLKLTWYDRIGEADPVDSYWTEQIDDDISFGGCGFVYETGPREFSSFSGSHIHIPSDVRTIVSPEYALWFWICL